MGAEEKEAAAKKGKGKKKKVSAAPSAAAAEPAAAASSAVVPAGAESLPPGVLRAAKEGGAQAVAAWVNAGGGVDAGCTYEGVTLLMAAAAGGHEAMVRMLLQRGASVNAQGPDGITALMCGNGNINGNTVVKINVVVLHFSRGVNRDCPLAFADCYNASCRRFCVLRFPKGRISGHVTVPAGLGAAGRHNKIITFGTSAHQPGRAS